MCEYLIGGEDKKERSSSQWFPVLGQEILFKHNKIPTFYCESDGNWIRLSKEIVDLHP